MIPHESAGLVFMGQYLALNVGEKGFPICIYNGSTSKILGRKRSLHSAPVHARQTLASKSPELWHLNLSPQIINTALLNCPSELISLSIFLWAARQPNYFHSSRSFDSMVPVAHRLSNRFVKLSRIVDELECIGYCRKAQALLVLMRIYWQGNLYNLALEAFDEMRHQHFVPNTFARNMILDILFKTGDFGVALRFLEETQFPNFITFNIVIRNLCKSGDWSSVCFVLQEMVNKRFWPNAGTYSMVFNCFHKAGRLMVLLQLLGFMIVSGEQFSVTIWTILIDAYCKVGKLDVASKLLWRMVASGFSPNVVTYTALIKAFLESDMHDEVLSLLDVMLSTGCKPDVVLCNVLIDSLGKLRRYDVAIDVFRHLCNRNVITPDSYTLSSLISTLCLSKRWSLFPKLVMGLNISVDPVLFNSLLNFLCKAGFPSQAVQLYIDMVSRGILPDKYSYTGLLIALCRSGKTEIAANVYGEIVANEPNADSYIHTVMLDGFIKTGKLHKAFKMFREAISANYCLDVVSYNIAIRGLLVGGRVEEARNLFEQMKQSGIVPNMYTYDLILRGFCKAKDTKAVMQVLGDMKTNCLEPMKLEEQFKQLGKSIPNCKL